MYINTKNLFGHLRFGCPARGKLTAFLITNYKLFNKICKDIVLILLQLASCR